MLNRKAYEHALSLIGQGLVNRESDWSFDAADGNAILGDPPDWERYATWFLLKRPEANPETKEAWAYPFGKNGKVYRSALTAIRQRAGQQNETELFEAAGRLIEEIDRPEEAKLTFVCDMPGSQVGASVPTEFQVFPYGRVELQGQDPVIVDEEAMEEVIKRFEKRGLDMVIDYEHQTLHDVQAPAAGWVKRLVNKGKEGLWAVVEWTDHARQYLANREYRYYSPVFAVSKEGRRLVALANIALTNAPKMNWIRPIVAKQGAEPNFRKEGRKMEVVRRLARLLGLSDDATEEQVVEAVTTKLKDLGAARGSGLSVVAKALGLKEDAGEEQVLDAIKARRPGDEGAVASREVLEALGLDEGASRSEIIATIHALKQTPNLIERVAKLEKDRAQREKEELVNAALKAGKITPAQREWAEDYAMKDPEGFRIFISKAPTIIPLGDAHLAKEKGKKADGLDELQLQINKMLGITDEAWKRYNPAHA